MCKTQTAFLQAIDLNTNGAVIHPGICGSCPDCTQHIDVSLRDYCSGWFVNGSLLIGFRGYEVHRFTHAETQRILDYLDGGVFDAEYKFSDLLADVLEYDVPDSVLDELRKVIISELIETGELADEPHFSWSPCESCGSSLGGNRYAAHSTDADGNISHWDICEDCLFYFANGDLPENWE